jgi:hypothetical protein
MTSPAPSAAGGSRTLAYVVAGVVATIPGIFVFGELLGLYGAITLEVVLWIAGMAAAHTAFGMRGHLGPAHPARLGAARALRQTGPLRPRRW